MRRIWLILAGTLLLLGAAQAQNLITPEQAIQAVRQFVGDPNAPATVEGFFVEEITSPFDTHYSVRVTDHPWTGSYYVRANDGTVISMVRSIPYMTEPPLLSMQEAQALAETFARRHYPPFAQRQWRLGPAPFIPNGSEYNFEWTEVLNKYGALGPYYLQITVNGITGDVVSYSIPPNRMISGPTVPRLTLQQAMAIAARYARFDPQTVPFSEVHLQVSEGSYGIQWLYWNFNQYPNPAEDPTLSYGISVDAITGRITGFSAPISSPLRKGPPTRAVPPLPKRKAIRLRLGSPKGRLVGSSAMPVIENGTLWVRAELLRGFGAQAQVDRKGVEIRAGEKSVSGALVGAKWREYGWWVPLRRTASVVGWRVDWLPLTQEAVVHVAPPPKGAAAPRSAVPFYGRNAR